IMTTRIQNLTIVLVLALTGVFLPGCASTEKANTISLLSAAGFHTRTPETPKQKEIYNSIDPNHVMRGTVKGKGVFYVYKDPDRGVAYVGREAEYQRYKQLAIQQQIAQDYYMAAEMNRQAAYGWY